MTTHELLVSNLLGWVLILYPTEALRPRWLTLKKAIWQLLPIFVFVAIDYQLPFPTVMDVQKVIEILQCNPTLIQSVEKASMHINLKSKYWVKETKTRFLFMKKPQCYDVCSGQLSTPAKDEMPYRLTIVYFYKGYLVW